MNGNLKYGVTFFIKNFKKIWPFLAYFFSLKTKPEKNPIITKDIIYKYTNDEFLDWAKRYTPEEIGNGVGGLNGADTSVFNKRCQQNGISYIRKKF